MQRTWFGCDLERTDDNTARLGLQPDGQNLDHLDLALTVWLRRRLRGLDPSRGEPVVDTGRQLKG